jgi:hypothetical protein
MAAFPFICSGWGIRNCNQRRDSQRINSRCDGLLRYRADVKTCLAKATGSIGLTWLCQPRKANAYPMEHESRNSLKPAPQQIRHDREGASSRQSFWKLSRSENQSAHDVVGSHRCTNVFMLEICGWGVPGAIGAARCRGETERTRAQLQRCQARLARFRRWPCPSAGAVVPLPHPANRHRSCWGENVPTAINVCGSVTRT